MDSDKSMDHFNKILEIRLKGVNLTRLAKDLEIPSSLLFEWKQARRLPSLKNIGHVKKLADHFGLTLEEILMDRSSPSLITSVMFEDNKVKYRIKIERLRSNLLRKPWGILTF